MAYLESFGANFDLAHSRVTFRLRGWSIDTTRAVIALIVIGTIIRIVLAGAVGYGTDESYTVANARYFDWSYVDYPPLHVWLVGITAWLSGSEAPVLLRLPFIALFAGSTWMMFRLTALLFDRTAGFWAALLFNLAPVFTLAHASWVLPDGPLAFFMLSGAYVAARMVFASDSPSRSIASWALAGLFAGLAMMTKYHGAFLLLVFSPSCLHGTPEDVCWRRPHPGSVRRLLHWYLHQRFSGISITMESDCFFRPIGSPLRRI